ncbi:MAG: hypothetical protein IJT37_10040 [Lachnospiraceae bacterium]|nr:hypothetical protein [Lachnospiraceae bacterium]
MNDVMQRNKLKSCIIPRFTRKNPSGSYRINLENGADIRIESDRISTSMFGPIVDALGAYEELTEGLTPDQIISMLSHRHK